MQPNKKYGVLLVNLGTPTEASIPAVRQFLKDFLSDPRVVDAPRILWLPVLYAVILRFRPKRVAKNYQKIWMEEGSPLMVYSKAQTRLLQERFDRSGNCKQVKAELAMTYGQPDISSSVTNLIEWGADNIIVLPLYPQFSHTTTSPVMDQLGRDCAQHIEKICVINDYHQHPKYIAALAELIKPKLKSESKLVMSFHGIPKRYVKNGDPYQKQCEKTASLLAEKLQLSEEQWELAYQSRVGREEWLTPYLDQRMTELPNEGVKDIVTVCPGFSSDCLETLEEISMENRDIFIQSGGESFDYVSALNDSPAHIEMMAELVLEKIG